MTRARSLKAFSILIALAVAATSAVATAAPAPPGMKVKPDLYIQSFTAAKAGSTFWNVQVRLTVKVGIRSAAATSTGPFKVRVEWREEVAGLRGRSSRRSAKSAWTALPEAGIASMQVDPASSRVPLEARTFDATVPGGKTYEFRAVVDSMDQVEESNETNNTETTTYEATICAETGVDLVFTQMRLQRRPDGDVQVDVWVENQCDDPCVSDIYYIIDDSDATGRPGTVERRILVRVNGNTEVGPVGATVVNGVAGRDLTYKVRIEPRGGSCPEASTVNNSCTGKILASETSKTVDCRIPTVMPFPSYGD